MIFTHKCLINDKPYWNGYGPKSLVGRSISFGPLRTEWSHPVSVSIWIQTRGVKSVRARLRLKENFTSWVELSIQDTKANYTRFSGTLASLQESFDTTSGTRKSFFTRLFDRFSSKSDALNLEALVEIQVSGVQEPEGGFVLVDIDPNEFINDILKELNPMTSILDEARDIVDSSRQAEYNDPVENAVREALVMSATLGQPFTPKMMVLAMHTKKLVRSGRGHKHDNVVDKAGYAEIEARVEKAMKDGTVQKIVEKLLGGWVKFDTVKPDTIVTGYLDKTHLEFSPSPFTTKRARLNLSLSDARNFKPEQILPMGERVGLIRLKDSCSRCSRPQHVHPDGSCHRFGD